MACCNVPAVFGDVEHEALVGLHTPDIVDVVRVHARARTEFEVAAGGIVANDDVHVLREYGRAVGANAHVNAVADDDVVDVPAQELVVACVTFLIVVEAEISFD